VENKQSYPGNPDDKRDGRFFGRQSGRALLLAAFLLILVPGRLWAQTAQLQFVPTLLNVYAGSGAANCSGTGNGGAATSAPLGEPTAVAADSLGNVYIADQACNVVRKVTPAGVISNFAGISSFGGGFSGDGGQATSAELNVPLDVAVDGSNNVYIADYSNHRIRVVNAATGVITTFAGDGNGFFNGGPRASTPISGPTGLAFDPQGNLYFATGFQHLVGKINTSGTVSLFAGEQVTSGSNAGEGIPGYTGDGGLAIDATLDDPQAVASDQLGNIYIADYNNNVIRMVNTSGIITTYAGNGTAGYMGDGGPALSAELLAAGVSADLAGNLYISSGSTTSISTLPPPVVRKVDTSGNITTYVGSGSGSTGGSATGDQLGVPGIARVDLYGDLIVPTIPFMGGEPTQVDAAGPQGILQFGNQNVGITSNPMTLTLVNTGNATLTFSSIAGSNFGDGAGIITGDFAVASGGTCTYSTLAPGATCTLNVTFTPATMGALTGTITFATNSPSTPNVVQLTGTGVTSSVTVTPSLAFGNQGVSTTSAAQVATLNNAGSTALTISGITFTGANPGDFAETSTCGSTVAAGATCTASVTFTPTATGSRSAILNFNDNASNSPQTVTVSGTGTVPAVNLSAASLSFGNQPLNTTSAAMTETVTNTGTANLNISTVAIGGTNPGDFAKTTDTCTGAAVVPNATCTVSVTFTPLGAGARSGTLTFTDNASDSPESATLTGTGAPPVAGVAPASLSFSSQNVGTTSASQPVALSNTGAATLTIASITASTNFGQTNTCAGSVAAGGSCTINVNFTPTAAGTLTGTLTVTDNSNGVTGSTQTVALSGTGAGTATASLSAASLIFSNQPISTTSTAQTVTVTNTGTLSLSIATATLGGTNVGDFSKTADTCTGATVAVNATCTVSVTFTPAATGALNGTLTFTDNNNNVAGSTQAVALSGTGVDFALAASPGTMNVPQGVPAVYTINLTSVGGTDSSAVALTCSNLPATATCGFSPSSATPGASGSSSTMTITTVAPSTARMLPPAAPSPPTAPLALLLAMLLPALTGWWRVRRRASRWTAAGLLFGTLLATAFLAGCGAGGFPLQKVGGTPAGTYTVTVTGTSGATQHSTTVTLTVTAIAS
jgi:hypothetical protein